MAYIVSCVCRWMYIGTTKQAREWTLLNTGGPVTGALGDVGTCEASSGQWWPCGEVWGDKDPTLYRCV